MPAIHAPSGVPATTAVGLGRYHHDPGGWIPPAVGTATAIMPYRVPATAAIVPWGRVNPATAAIAFSCHCVSPFFSSGIHGTEREHYRITPGCRVGTSFVAPTGIRPIGRMAPCLPSRFQIFCFGGADFLQLAVKRHHSRFGTCRKTSSFVAPTLESSLLRGSTEIPNLFWAQIPPLSGIPAFCPVGVGEALYLDSCCHRLFLSPSDCLDSCVLYC